MEKRLLLFLLLSFGLMFVYTQLLSPPAEEPGKPGKPGTEDPAGPGTEDPVEPGTEPPVEPPDGSDPVDPEEKPPVAEPSGAGLEVVAAGAGEKLVVEQPLARWVFDSFGGSVRSVALKRYAKQADQDLTSDEHWYRALADIHSDGETPNTNRSMTLRVMDAEGKRVLALDRVLWELVERDGRVVYRLSVPEAGLEFRKTYIFPDAVEGLDGAYHVDVNLVVKVLDRTLAEPYITGGLRLSLRGPGGMPVEEFNSGPPVVGVVQVSDMADPEEVSPPRKVTDAANVFPESDEQGESRWVEWTGMHSRFFVSVLKTVRPKETDARTSTFEAVPDHLVGGKDFVNVAPALNFILPLEKVDSASRDFLFYVGPMDPDILSAAPYVDFKSVIDYGLFEPIVKLLVFLLNAIHSVVGNWGLAIIMLTLIVRASLFPLSRKSQVSMQKYQRQMARLKPKIDEIKKRNVNNKKKQQEEQMKLMREEGMQMFPAGCLVMFLQLPIFIGLFQALRYTIGLRHSAFLWATDLTAPDRLAGPWANHGIPLLWDPLYLNVLPILMGITWYLSSAMAPKPVDPQQAQQMKMMK
jgi:YidC/Oxa1 family membrane protein insertase